MPYSAFLTTLILTLSFCALPSVLNAQSHNPLKIQKLQDNIHVITGSGGNVAVFIGEEGTFVIDDKFAKNAEEIHSLIKSVGGEIPKFLVNTHFHGDHSGGNAYFGEKGSIIVAHHNVHKRLKEGYTVKAFKTVALPAKGAALPSLTYGESVDIYLNNETIKLHHLPKAHTDTDTIVYFNNANVMHLGDLMFNGFFPFIDTDNGGSLKGVITALETAKNWANSDTLIIPGHGPMASIEELDATIATLKTSYERLSKLKQEGLNLEQTIAKNPLSDIEKKWGGVLFNAEKWITIVWQNL
jgi:glyoxylase-like metal-dependent hydrolase (beta-lactamase superfamily II)